MRLPLALTSVIFAVTFASAHQKARGLPMISLSVTTKKLIAPLPQVGVERHRPDNAPRPVCLSTFESDWFSRGASVKRTVVNRGHARTVLVTGASIAGPGRYRVLVV